MLNNKFVGLLFILMFFYPFPFAVFFLTGFLVTTLCLLQNTTNLMTNILIQRRCQGW